MGEQAHGTWNQQNKKGSGRPITVKCSCGWSAQAFDYGDAQQLERSHKIIVKTYSDLNLKNLPKRG